MDKKRPLSDNASQKVGNPTGCLVIFFGIFFFVGLLFFFKMVALPLWSIYTAISWKEYPCVIISSEVETHEDSDGDTYKIKIYYYYTINGVRYQSDRYDFTDFFSNGYESKAAIVAQYPAGSESFCYVNPKNKSQSVLNRGFSPTLLPGMLTLVFVAIGGGGIIFALRANRKKTLSQFDKIAGTYKINNGPLLLKSRNSPARKFFSLLFVMILWNGIVT